MSTATFDRRSLPIARSELRAVANRLRGERCWTIKDPVTLRYFQLREEEYFIWQLLDGEHSLDDIIALFEQQFAPRRLKRSKVSGFVMMLHREGLTVASAFGQSDHLLARRAERWRGQWLGQLVNVLAIKLPGINPDRWLAQVVQSLGWLFSPMFVAACGSLLVAALVLLGADLGQAWERVPRFNELIGPGNLVSMFVALAFVKTLHELGHALACKHFGGECNRLGVMFLLFTPALYCDVSDAWMFPERWRRIAVSVAGIAVELVLASIATLLWSITQPGWFNTLLFNVMVICSVGTLLINGNPLLRYDGYFICADWLGIPNLREQANGMLRRLFAYYFAGVELEEPRTLVESRPAFLLFYGISSLIYRWLMIGGILWLLYVALEPRGLVVLAQLVTVLVLMSQMIEPVTKASRYLADPTRRERVRWGRLWFSVLVLLVVGSFALAIPCPRRVASPVVLQSASARQVYVTTPGVLEESLGPGAKVVADQVVAKLRSRALELEIAELAARTDLQRLTLAQLQIRQHTDEAQGEGLPVAAQALADLESQLVEKRRQQAELILMSPIAGTVLPPRSHTPAVASGELPGFDGTALEPNNVGCYLEAGTLLCSIGSPDHFEALAIVHESEIPLLSVGQHARVIVNAAPGVVLAGEVQAISKLNASELPPELLDSGAFASERGPNGRLRPQGNYYQAIIQLDQHDVPLLSGGLGHAKIIVAPEPLGLRLYRNLRGTFRLPF